jgi:hypothetical protein
MAMEGKKPSTPFWLGLGIGLAIFGLFYLFFGFAGQDKLRPAPDGKQPADPALHLDDWDGVNLDSAAEFIKKRGIDVIAFIDAKGGFYVAGRDGGKLEGWCKNDGTAITGNCTKLHAERISHLNQFTVFVTEASPGCPFYSVGGRSRGCQ